MPLMGGHGFGVNCCLIPSFNKRITVHDQAAVVSYFEGMANSFLEISEVL